jgi:outer membrane lipoprotein-sorting protein
VKGFVSKVTLSVSLAVVLVCVAGAPAPVYAQTTFDPRTDAVFQKMLGVNKGLQSYEAHVDVQTRLPLGSFTLHGTLYDLGDRSKVVFDHVPAIARSSVENQPSIGAASNWPKLYAISLISRTPGLTTYRLVPVSAEGVRSIDAVVDNASGLVQEYVWSNTNGLTITSDQTYELVGGYQLVGSVTSKTRGAGVRADSTTTFTNYQLNVTVPESVFTANS